MHGENERVDLSLQQADQRLVSHLSLRKTCPAWVCPSALQERHGMGMPMLK